MKNESSLKNLKRAESIYQRNYHLSTEEKTLFFFLTDFAIFLWKWALTKYSFALFEFSILGILTTVEHYYSLAVKNQQITRSLF